ncbi:MAG: response regulator transcription factor [Saprospiraceae bacterium]|nr:response regulator transcription factor [Saprospiraceae bacterium]
MQKILIVEDDAHIAALISRTLQENNYEVLVAFDGKMALTLFDQLRPNLVITDLIMPHLGGQEFCRQIRSRKSNVPIIMLTALNGTEDVVEGLDAGADDYMVKPFRVPELLARVRALLRRVEQSEDKQISTVADLVLDHETKAVSRNQEIIKLTATEFRLLEFLIRNKNRLKTRMEILEEVWGMSFDPNTNVVDVYINYLRNKIDKPFDKKLLHTQVGLGFILKE